jgi:hypothetical protein
MEIDKLKESLSPKGSEWEEGVFIPHQQPEVPVHYILNDARTGGTMKPSDPLKPLPKELYDSSGAVVSGWWSYTHDLRLSNRKTIGILRVWKSDREGEFGFDTSSADEVKISLAAEE